MKIIMEVGSKLTVQFADADGEFEIEFTDAEISIKTEWPDSDGKVGKVYSERYASDFEKFLTEELAMSEKL